MMKHGQAGSIRSLVVFITVCLCTVALATTVVNNTTVLFAASGDTWTNTTGNRQVVGVKLIGPAPGCTYSLNTYNSATTGALKWGHKVMSTPTQDPPLDLVHINASALTYTAAGEPTTTHGQLLMYLQP